MARPCAVKIGLRRYAVANEAMAKRIWQQTHEIGIRMALGAQPSTVLKLVVGEGLKLAAAGLVVGLIGALLEVRVLSSLLFNVSTHDPITLVGVSLVLIVTAALACYIPARRATRVDPLIALRFE